MIFPVGGITGDEGENKEDAKASGKVEEVGVVSPRSLQDRQ